MSKPSPTTTRLSNGVTSVARYGVTIGEVYYVDWLNQYEAYPNDFRINLKFFDTENAAIEYLMNI